MASRAGENMTFFERLHNTYVFVVTDHFFRRKNIPRSPVKAQILSLKMVYRFVELVYEKFPGLPLLPVR